MPRPWTETLLSTWERAGSEPQLTARTLALLGLGGVDFAPDSLVDLTIGQRDGLLMKVREKLFGGNIDALAACAGCGERVELSFNLAEIRSPATSEPVGKLTISSQGFAVEFRLPNSRDLLAISDLGDIENKRKRLLERIVLRAHCEGRRIDAGELPQDVILLMESRMEAADQDAEVNLRLCCQSCGHEWSQLFDIGSFLWREVDSLAVRLLREVHLLARAYAWSEAEIIAMTPLRRHAYLGMLSA